MPAIIHIIHTMDDGFLSASNNIIVTVITTQSQHCAKADPCQLHQLLPLDAGPPCAVVAVTSRDAIGCHSQRKLGDRGSAPNG